MLKLRADARQRDEWERTAAIRRDLYDRWKKEEAPPAEMIDPIIHNPVASHSQREQWAKKCKGTRRKGNES